MAETSGVWSCCEVCRETNARSAGIPAELRSLVPPDLEPPSALPGLMELLAALAEGALAPVGLIFRLESRLLERLSMSPSHTFSSAGKKLEGNKKQVLDIIGHSGGDGFLY